MHGALPQGSFAHGYYNVHGDSPIGGHIKADNCKAIAFVVRGLKRVGMSVQFYNAAGEAAFKIFVRRDANRELVPEQVKRFEALRLRQSALDTLPFSHVPHDGHETARRRARRSSPIQGSQT